MSVTRCVLLAEDDPNDVFLFEHALESAQVSNPLHIVTDGQETIDYLSAAGAFSDRNRFPMPCLLILDVKMPRKSGLDVLEWLRANETLRALPKMMLSSSAHPDEVDKAYQLGANAFLVKPSGVAQRVELARMIKGFWLNMNEPPRICR